jgi:nucleotide-binding universal stress UspA family protein
MKKILIALDYDPTSQKVAEMGFELGKAMAAEITLIHVQGETHYYIPFENDPIMAFVGYVDTVYFGADVNNKINEISQLFLDKTKLHLGDENIKTIVAQGDFALSIIEAATNIHADMIVIGSHSKKWLEKIIMGSVTEKVLSHTIIPTLIISTKNIN